MSTREEAIRGIRMLAALLEQNPDVPLPYELGGGSSITFHFLSDPNARQNMAALARLIPGAFSKEASGGGDFRDYIDLRGNLAGVKVILTAFREQVCERVVLGTREVTEEVPDPEALAQVPKVTVTTTVEDVEWRCAPVLAGESR